MWGGGGVPAGYINCVAPDVVIELGGADDACRYIAIVISNPEDEVELDEGLVEVSNGSLQLQYELHELSEMLIGMGVFPAHGHIHAGSGHERRPDGLDFLHVAKFWTVKHLWCGNEVLNKFVIRGSSYEG